MQIPDTMRPNDPHLQPDAGVSTTWCAVHTRYQHESSVHTLLSMKGFHTFFPTYRRISRWKDRKKEMTAALFPGYVFAADVRNERLSVLSTPGVCSIVSIAGVPAVIPNHEIESIRRAVGSPYSIEPHAYLREGDLVRITRGPLNGIEGILVRKKGSLRLVVSVEMLGRAAAIEIDGASIEAVKLSPFLVPTEND